MIFDAVASFDAEAYHPGASSLKSRSEEKLRLLTGRKYSNSLPAELTILSNSGNYAENKW